MKADHVGLDGVDPVEQRRLPQPLIDQGGDLAGVDNRDGKPSVVTRASRIRDLFLDYDHPEAND